MGFADKLSNAIYIILLAAAMLLPFYSLYLIMILMINPVSTIVIWQLVVAALFFMEFLSSAIKK